MVSVHELPGVPHAMNITTVEDAVATSRFLRGTGIDSPYGRALQDYANTIIHLLGAFEDQLQAEITEAEMARVEAACEREMQANPQWSADLLVSVMKARMRALQPA